MKGKVKEMLYIFLRGCVKDDGCDPGEPLLTRVGVQVFIVPVEGQTQTAAGGEGQHTPAGPGVESERQQNNETAGPPAASPQVEQQAVAFPRAHCPSQP